LIKTKIKREKILLLNFIRLKFINYNYYKFFILNYNKNILNFFFEKYKIFIYYNKLLLLNEYKFNEFFLIKFKQLIKSFYNKDVYFRIINLKKLYLNSDIFLQSLVIKLKNRMNKIYYVLMKSFALIRLPNLNKYIITDSHIKVFNLFNLEDFIFYNKNLNYKKKITIRKHVLNSLKYKYINGIKLEGKGRLTKRLTAQRAILKSKSKGNLRNIHILNNIPLLRGHLKSNLQYTNLNSKNPNGSFGLKG
jgi:hypothetical protein